MDLSQLPDLTSSTQDLAISSRTVAYFSMEIALSPALPTYSGGLGVLAGDTLRSAADCGTPMMAVSLVHRRGYFRQHLDSQGQQTESDVPWSPETTLPSANQIVTINMQGREVHLQAWRFDVVGVNGYVVPVFLLDSDMEGNDPWDRHLTDHLYGGDTYYRLCQETILGIGGIALLNALGAKPKVYHMNEGHASLLTIGLLETRLAGAPLRDATDADIDAVRQQATSKGFSLGYTAGIEAGLDIAVEALLSLSEEDLVAKRREFIQEFGSEVQDDPRTAGEED